MGWGSNVYVLLWADEDIFFLLELYCQVAMVYRIVVRNDRIDWRIIE